MATLDVIANAAARPGSPSDGDMYYQSDLQQIVLYDGTATAWRVYDPDAAPYDLDGTNILSTKPIFHFDAARVNGSSTASGDNPVNDQVFDGTTDSDNPTGGVWTSRVNGVTASQSTASDQPTYKTSGANSQPYFLHAADHLNIAVNSEIPARVGAFTVFAFMISTANTMSFGGSLALSNNVTCETLWLLSSNYNYLYYNAANDAAANPDIDGSAADMSVSGQGRMLVMTRDASNNSKLFVDGANTNSSLDGDDFAGTFLGWDCIGATLQSSNKFETSGDIYELAFWNSELSTADKNKLVTYCNTRYGTGRNAAGTGTFARVAFS